MIVKFSPPLAKRIALAAMAVAIAGGAYAAEMTPNPDANITRAEAQAEAAQQFDKLDVNHDGKLDATDRAAMRDRRFDKMDTNHDGELSRGEFDHAGGPPPPEGAGPEGAGPNGEHRHGEHGAHRGGQMGMAMMVLHRADPNHTGSVTKQAYVNAALAMFDEADTNHDGTLTKPEREAAHAKMRAEMRKHWAEHQGAAGGDHDRGGPDGGMPPMDPPMDPAH